MSDVILGDDCAVQETVRFDHEGSGQPPVIGDGAVIRAGTIIYGDVRAGDNLQTGHHAVVRERTTLGDDVVVGTCAVVDGRADLGDGVSLQTGAYVPPESRLGDRVFVGPGATLTNDPYPLRRDVGLAGPTLRDDVSVGANATVLPGVEVGAGAFVAAAAVVTEDVPPRTLAVGAPAHHRELPETLDGGNTER